MANARPSKNGAELEIKIDHDDPRTGYVWGPWWVFVGLTIAAWIHWEWNAEALLALIPIWLGTAKLAHAWATKLPSRKQAGGDTEAGRCAG